MKNKIPLIIIVTFLLVFFFSCAKKCDCFLYEKNDIPVDQPPEERTMPRSLKLDCSFFDTYVDSVGGFKCQ